MVPSPRSRSHIKIHNFILILFISVCTNIINVYNIMGIMISY